MKRRVLTLALLLTLLVTLPGMNMLAVEVGTKTGAQLEVEAVVEAYLRKCAEALYLGKTVDISADTILRDLENPTAEIQEDVTSLTDFRTRKGLDVSKELGIQETGTTSLKKNLKLQEDRVAYFRYLHESQEVTYAYFMPSYTFAETVVSGDYAVTDVWEALDYQYSGKDFTSFEGRNYRISLMKTDGRWQIAEVVSDDEFFQANIGGDFNLATAIRGVREAAELNIDTFVPSEVDNAVTAAAAGSYTYSASAAVEYAVKYASTHYNSYYHNPDNNCMAFVSQCIRAGFGGTDSYAAVGNRERMDTSGSPTWYSTNINATSSWMSCSSFRSYLNNSASDTTRLVCDQVPVAYNSNALGVSTSKLLGAAVHVKGEVALGHAVFITKVEGTTRDTVYTSAFNSQHCNRKMSVAYMADNSDTSQNLLIIIPKTATLD